ncbi:MAG: dihydrofolate reductase [Saprospiraceae bacterium]|nr:dihydrofolate reductase [Saprospiraceae bacterium]
MIISAIAAYANNRAIGKGNDLPWHLPADMKYFMRTTKGHHVIMGRKTYQSMGRPLSKRTNIVITRDPFFVADGTIVVHTIEEALSVADGHHEQEVFIIGGGEIYQLAWPWLDRLYLTEIELEVEDAEVHFPPFDLSNWQVISEDSHQPDEKNHHPFTFRVLERKTIA